MQEETKDCVICLDALNTDVITFSCSHALHTDCFSQYVQHHLEHASQQVPPTSLLTCPTCKRNVLRIETHSTTQPELQHNLSAPFHINIPYDHRHGIIPCHNCCVTLTNIMICFGVSLLVYYVATLS